MTEEHIRRLVHLGARTIPGSVLWPSGNGFDSGTVQFEFSEAYHGWTARTERRRAGGRTPEEALSNLWRSALHKL